MTVVLSNQGGDGNYTIFCLKQSDVCNASSKDFRESSRGGTVLKGGWLHSLPEATC